jgi:hypothetical protein
MIVGLREELCLIQDAAACKLGSFGSFEEYAKNVSLRDWYIKACPFEC